MISKQKPTPGVHLQKKQAHRAVNSAPVNSRQNEYSQWRLQNGTVLANCNANFIEPGVNYDRKGRSFEFVWYVRFTSSRLFQLLLPCLTKIMSFTTYQKQSWYSVMSSEE